LLERDALERAGALYAVCGSVDDLEDYLVAARLVAPILRPQEPAR
jgi:hypothetical protein